MRKEGKDDFNFLAHARTDVPRLCAEVRRVREELRDLQATFDLRWKSDMRAIKQWQSETSGRELIWPDHTDLSVWLMGELDRLRAKG